MSLLGILLLYPVPVALWLWMARTNRRGRSWARITSTVFFGVLTAGGLAALIWSLKSPHSFSLIGYPLTVSFCLVYWLTALSVVVLLWQRSASDYYAAASDRSKAIRAAARKQP
jgi:cytochrome bd-type quinol oxidase subunit 2